MKTITIEVDRATDAQFKTLLADLSLSIEPWQRYIRYKIKNGKRTYKRQALTIKPQATSVKRQATSARRARSTVG